MKKGGTEDGEWGGVWKGRRTKAEEQDGRAMEKKKAKKGKMKRGIGRVTGPLCG